MDGAAKPALITLTSDFGYRDPWAACMKGVILSIAPETRLVDLSHGIAPQNILEGALFLAAALPTFPSGTIHVAVVDPGVGTARKPIIAQCGGQFVVCPDNGLLTLIERTHPVEAAVAIETPAFIAANPSATFHGRDIFAPAAAHLALGVALADFGPAVGERIKIPVPEATLDKNGQLHGEVIHVDRFGNCITNICRDMVPGDSDYRVQVAAATLPTILRTYGDAPPGTLMALFGSSGHLEIAISMDNAARMLQLDPGTPVTLYHP